MKKLNNKMVLLGNEAIVRSAIENGVQFISTYPGTPASEIGDLFYQIKKGAKILGLNQKIADSFYFEYSINEKNALEAGIGASFSGLKTLVAMKSFGLNVCSDALFPFLYTGCKGPFVIILADDPGCHSSAQSEQDSRAYAYLAHLPFLEPSDPQECFDFVKLAFELSSKFKLPILIRTTTRVAHQREIVKISSLKISSWQKGKFIKDPKRFVTFPPRIFEMKKELLEKIRKIKNFAEKSSINKTFNFQLSTFNFQSGIITSGVSYLYVMEALKELNLNLPVLKLGFFYPLPSEKIKKFISLPANGLKKVLIVEELEPYLEKEIKELAKEANPKLQIFGRNFLPEIGELKPEMAISAVAKFTNSKLKIENSLKIENCKLKISQRFPQLCPDCPYWFVFSAIKKAVDQKQVIFGGDIGCYMLAGLTPHNLQDYLFCMGASLGIGHGIKKATTEYASEGSHLPTSESINLSTSEFMNLPTNESMSEGSHLLNENSENLHLPIFSEKNKTSQKLIALIGDSTFFHVGIPALINIVHNQSNPLIILLNNQTTAMTGHQPYPENENNDFTKVKIEDIIKACGVKNLKILEPKENFDEMVQTIKDFLEKKEVSVIITRRKCARIK